MFPEKWAPHIYTNESNESQIEYGKAAIYVIINTGIYLHPWSAWPHHHFNMQVMKWKTLMYECRVGNKHFPTCPGKC